MRRYFFIILFLLLMVCQMSSARPIVNEYNPHNMAYTTYITNRPKALARVDGGTDQICIFCHTPHAAVPQTPLWNRPAPTTITFPLYNSALAIKGDLPGTPAGAQGRSQYTNTDSNITYPNGASRMCLSCHDGATAIGILNDGTTIAMAGGNDFVTGTAEIDLSTSHPISFVYDNAVLADVLAARGVGTYQLPPSGDFVDTPLDGGNRMQCTTCHDPHNDASETGLPPFWRHTTLVNNAFADEYEEVCGQCHVGGTPSGPMGDHNPGPGI